MTRPQRALKIVLLRIGEVPQARMTGENWRATTGVAMATIKAVAVSSRAAT
jgi:hypothetical protein